MIAQLILTYFSQNEVFKVQWCFSQIEQFSVFKGWIILSHILYLELVNIPSFLVYILYHINFMKYIIKHYQHSPFVFFFHLLWISKFISCQILWIFQKNLDASKNLCFYYFVYVHERISMCIGTFREQKGTASPRVGITYSHELPYVGARNWVQVIYKNIKVLTT